MVHGSQPRKRHSVFFERESLWFMVLGSQGKKRRNGFHNSEKLKRQISLVHGSRFTAKKKGREDFLKFNRKKEKRIWFMVHGSQPRKRHSVFFERESLWFMVLGSQGKKRRNGFQ